MEEAFPPEGPLLTCLTDIPGNVFHGCDKCGLWEWQFLKPRQNLSSP